MSIQIICIINKSKGVGIDHFNDPKAFIEYSNNMHDYKDCLFNGEAILKSQQRFKSDHKVYREEVNKIILSSDDDKRLQTFNRITTYPYGTPAVKVCANEIMVMRIFFVKKYVNCPFHGEMILKQ